MECHTAESEAWTNSHHGWALREAIEGNVLGDFSEARFEHAGVTTRFYRSEDRYMVETDGADGKMAAFEVRYTVGVAPLQQYLVETERGRLQALDIAWDTVEGKWFHLYPDQRLAAGDGLHWTGTYKNWQSRCAECHQTGFDKGYDHRSGSYSTTWKELTVSCESCHGPAADHVAWARQSPPSSPRPSVLKLGRGEQESELAACGPCHARREAFSQQSAPAGSPFGNHYNLSLLSPDLYFADGQQNAEVFILGSFLQSKMKAKGVTCSDCHEPHSGTLIAEGNAVCTQCHGEAGNAAFPTLALKEYDSEAHHHHPAGSPAAQCVTCHMPERTYMVNDPRRDHFFRRPDPLQSKAAGAPDVCTQCHADETPEWAASHIARWFPNADRSWQDRSAFIAFHSGDRSPAVIEDLAAYARNMDRPAIVRATAASMLRNAAPPSLRQSLTGLLSDSDDIVRAAAASLLGDTDQPELLQKVAGLLSDESRSVRQAAALQLVVGGNDSLDEATRVALSRALAEYMDSRAANADTPEAHMALGGLALGLRRWTEAETAFATAAGLDPQLEQAWVMRVRIRAAFADDETAGKLLTEALRLLPESAALMMEQAALESRRGNEARAIDWYRRIVAIDQENAEAWYRLADSAIRSGNAPLAIDAAARLIALEPGNAEAHVTAAIAHYIAGDRLRAKSFAAESRRLSPGIRLPDELEQLLQP